MRRTALSRVLALLLGASACGGVAAPSAHPPVVAVAPGDDLQALLDTLRGPATVQLAPGDYHLEPVAFTDSTCGNCQDPNEDVPATRGLLVRGDSIALAGGTAGHVVLHTHAGYGVLFDGCADCALERVTVTDGARDADGRATDAGVVIRGGRVTLSDCVVRDNLGDSATVHTVVVGIMGIAVREGGDATVRRCRIERNSWDGIAGYRGAHVLAEDNVVDGVDAARGAQMGGGRGVGIGLTWDAEGVLRGNLVTRYWKGIGVFVDAKASITGNVVEDVLTWGLAYWGPDAGRPVAWIARQRRVRDRRVRRHRRPHGAVGAGRGAGRGPPRDGHAARRRPRRAGRERLRAHGPGRALRLRRAVLHAASHRAPRRSAGLQDRGQPDLGRAPAGRPAAGGHPRRGRLPHPGRAADRGVVRLARHGRVALRGRVRARPPMTAPSGVQADPDAQGPARADAEPDGPARLRALARPDKWFLSAGDGFLWAPPFPRRLDRPGFWDTAHVYHFPIEPLFSVALVGDDGRERLLRRTSMDWRPDRLEVRWEGPGNVRLTELRYVLPGGRFCSAWWADEKTDQGSALDGASLVAFTAVPGPNVRDLGRLGAGLRWRSTLFDRRRESLDVTLTLEAVLLPPKERNGGSPGADPDRDAAAEATRCAALRSEGGAEPHWDLTPFVELWRGDGTTRGTLGDGPTSLDGVSDRGWAHLAVALPLDELAPDRGVGFVHQVRPEALGGAPRPDRAVPPLPRHSADAWSRAIEAYPRLSSSDPYLARYFDYRIYGLHLNRIAGGGGRIPHPAVAEGIEYFHLPITYSAQCHMMETRWSADPAVARGSLLNFLAAQRPDGSLPGRLYVNHETGEDFYHANWADAAFAVDAIHPDRAFLEAAYAGLARYADWMRRERDPESSGMVTVVNHYETGQEYMSRYLAVDPSSDVTEWEPRLRLKGVDVTVYAYQLLRGLEAMAARLGRNDDVDTWSARATRVGRAIREEMWDEEAGIFSDVDGATGRRTGVKAAVCFYPLLTDLLEDAHVDRLLGHLSDPASFATPFPVPSSSADDPLFSAEGLWKGKRHNCPWNGRVWPMTNSHVVEGLLRQWHRGRAAAGPTAGHVLSRFVRMMFHEGDLARPNCYEHYNPRTGHACVFRGIDDYQHSWVLDLLARGVTGVEPTAAALRIHPLPMGLEHARFRGRLRGRDIDVRVRGEEVEARVDGAVLRTRIGEPVEVAW